MTKKTPQEGPVGPESATGTAPVLTEQSPQKRSVFSRIGFTQIALILLTAAFTWQWLASQRTANDMQEQLARKIAEMNGASKSDRSLLTQSQDQMHELSARIATLEARFAETRNQRAALDALYADLSASRGEAVLAEIEQMLLSAAQQAQLSASAKVALIALQNADARLQRTNLLAFGELRRVIGQDIARLRALPQADISAVNVQLEKLMTAVDSLPLASRQRTVAKQEPPAAAPEGEKVWQKLLREIGEEARQLVRIENTGMNEIPLLPPEQEFFLRENLKLRLMSARLALLSRNEEAFRQELKTAQLWTARYFDGKSNESARMTSGLKNLATADIHVETPDVSRSLQAVQNLRLTREGESKAGFDQRTRSSQ